MKVIVLPGPDGEIIAVYANWDVAHKYLDTGEISDCVAVEVTGE